LKLAVEAKTIGAMQSSQILDKASRSPSTLAQWIPHFAPDSPKASDDGLYESSSRHMIIVEEIAHHLFLMLPVVDDVLSSMNNCREKIGALESCNPRNPMPIAPDSDEPRNESCVVQFTSLPSELEKGLKDSENTILMQRDAHLGCKQLTQCTGGFHTDISVEKKEDLIHVTVEEDSTSNGVRVVLQVQSLSSIPNKESCYVDVDLHESYSSSEKCQGKQETFDSLFLPTSSLSNFHTWSSCTVQNVFPATRTYFNQVVESEEHRYERELNSAIAYKEASDRSLRRVHWAPILCSDKRSVFDHEEDGHDAVYFSCLKKHSMVS